MSNAVEKIIRQLNDFWLRGDYAALGELFHDDAVLLPPSSPHPIKGREAIVDGYRRFGDMGDVHEFEIGALETYMFGNTAMCHMHFRIDYALNEQRYQEAGVEIYALSGGDKDWKIVWRTQIADSRD